MEEIMKKKLVLVLAAMTISTAAAGCAKHEKIATPVVEETTAATEESTEAADETANMANPWVTTDKEGLLAATGFDMEAPEGATDVIYSYMEGDMLAQMDYMLDGMIFVYRMQFADEFTDISGMEYTWDGEEDGTVSDRQAKYYVYTGSETEDGIQMVNWYDAVPGVMYSLSAMGSDLDGMDIQAYAENIFVPLQGEVDGDVDGDAEGDSEAVEEATEETTAAIQ